MLIPFSGVYNGKPFLEPGLKWSKCLTMNIDTK